ncbi:hypothetical protein SDC9_152431 [bioreactor metagenome]|uniref:Uncharacterized protein n=1 Tax=bioreactor metagenome TaxID=1076179 RepID=A0A645ET16_9ZZZZ
MNNGTSIGSMFFALRIILPEAKSAPLAVCAFIILSVSSSKVGIKRKAIVIIIASSCAGTPIFLNGFRIASIPSVKTIGDVVKVSIEDIIKSKIRRRDILMPMARPSLVIVRYFHDHKISP